MTFHLFLGCTPISQFTTCPSNSASSWFMFSSVAINKFFNDSCTKAAVLSFFSKDGRAAFLGGDAGVRKYVCLGGNSGKKLGRPRNVDGMVGPASSSSEDKSSGEDERGEADRSAGAKAFVADSAEWRRK